MRTRSVNPDGAEWALLDRYFAGECSAREREQVEEWAAAGPEHQAAFAWARTMFGASATLPRPMWFDRETDAAWRSAVARANVPIALEAPALGRPLRAPWRGAPRSRRSWRSATFTVVAVAVALILGVAVGRRTRTPRQTAVREFTTAPGQRLTLTLVDGTQFTLAPASHLYVPLDYSRSGRSVTLEGEAYFTVAHDERHPFAVRAGNAVARDVGTQFDVRAYPGDPTVRVAVAEGQVCMMTRRGCRPLGVGDLASVGDTGLTILHNANISALTGWTQGQLTFTDESVVNVVQELSRWYGVRITVADPALRGRHLTASFTSESIGNVLQVVARSVGAGYRLHGDGAELFTQSETTP